MTVGIYLLAARSDLADVALRCMCTLLTEATHFNFRANLMTCIVTRLSKKSWDQVCPRLYIFIAYPQLYNTTVIRVVPPNFVRCFSRRSHRHGVIGNRPAFE